MTVVQVQAAAADTWLRDAADGAPATDAPPRSGSPQPALESRPSRRGGTGDERANSACPPASMDVPAATVESGASGDGLAAMIGTVIEPRRSGDPGVRAWVSRSSIRTSRSRSGRRRWLPSGASRALGRRTSSRFSDGEAGDGDGWRRGRRRARRGPVAPAPAAPRARAATPSARRDSRWINAAAVAPRSRSPPAPGDSAAPIRPAGSGPKRSAAFPSSASRRTSRAQLTKRKRDSSAERAAEKSASAKRSRTKSSAARAVGGAPAEARRPAVGHAPRRAPPPAAPTHADDDRGARQGHGPSRSARTSIPTARGPSATGSPSVTGLSGRVAADRPVGRRDLPRGARLVQHTQAPPSAWPTAWSTQGMIDQAQVVPLGATRIS